MSAEHCDTNNMMVILPPTLESAEVTPQKGVVSLSEALELDDYAAYMAYVKEALVTQDRKSLSCEMLVCIREKSGSLRARQRLVSTAELPWSKIHGKYLCCDWAFIGYGSNLFSHRHIPYPGLYLKKLVSKQLCFPECQSYSIAEKLDLWSTKPKGGPTCYNIDRFADLLLYHSAEMYAEFTPADIVDYLGKAIVNYIDIIKALISAHKDENIVKYGMRRDQLKDISKCLSLLDWVCFAHLPEDVCINIFNNLDILLTAVPVQSMKTVILRMPQTAMKKIVEMSLNKLDDMRVAQFMSLAAMFYPEWTDEQVETLLSVNLGNEQHRVILRHRSIAGFMQSNGYIITGSTKKTALIRDVLSGRSSAMSKQSALDGTVGSDAPSNNTLSLVIARNISASSSKEDDRLLKPYAEALSGKLIPLVTAPDPEVVFSNLQRTFPWAERLNEVVCRQVAMNRMGRGHAYIRPLLIYGKPGVGKTRYAQFLSECLGVPFTLFSAAGSADSMLLKGSSRGWSNSRPSFAIETIFRSKVANPLILVDEIDKANKSQNNGSIEQYLHGVLEPGSASQILDECLMVPVNLSAVSWILTANHIEHLSSSFLSRLISIELPQPSVQHHETLVRGMLGGLTKEYQIHDAMVPDISMSMWNTFMGAAHNPRMLKKMMETWLGESARQVRMH
jgi:hypothetical protein